MNADATQRPSPTTVDVLIVSHNTRELLLECLASLDRHRPPADQVCLKVRVWDNASTDGTQGALRERYPDVILSPSSQNDGFAHACNRLVAASSADYLLLLNPDTVLLEDVVSPLLSTLRSDSRIAIVGPRLLSGDGTVQLSSQRLPSLSYELALALRGTKLGRLGRGWDAARAVERVRQAQLINDVEPRMTEFLWATCWLLARADVERFGLFDPSFPLYDEDLDLCTRLLAQGRSLVYHPDVKLIHHGGASSTSEQKLKLMRAARTHYYRVHRGRLVALCYQRAVPLLWRLRLTRARRGVSLG